MGTEMAVKMPNTTVTMTTSMSVNPDIGFLFLASFMPTAPSSTILPRQGPKPTGIPPWAPHVTQIHKTHPILYQNSSYYITFARNDTNKLF